MNFAYGEIVDLRVENGMQVGSVRVAGTIKKVPLESIPHARCGNKVLMCDGVAIAEANDSQITNHGNYVSGKLLAIVSPDDGDLALKALQSHWLGKDAAVIGQVVDEHPGFVIMKTRVGGTRVVDMLSGEQLPRIC